MHCPAADTGYAWHVLVSPHCSTESWQSLDRGMSARILHCLQVTEVSVDVDVWETVDSVDVLVSVVVTR
jgi:hypothetical protein